MTGGKEPPGLLGETTTRSADSHERSPPEVGRAKDPAGGPEPGYWGVFLSTSRGESNREVTDSVVPEPCAP
jgi:hypothetical protein